MSQFEIALSNFLLKIFVVELILLFIWVKILVYSYQSEMKNLEKFIKKSEKTKEKKLRKENFPFDEGEEVIY